MMIMVVMMLIDDDYGSDVDRHDDYGSDDVDRDDDYDRWWLW